MSLALEKLMNGREVESPGEFLFGALVGPYCLLTRSLHCIERVVVSARIDICSLHFVQTFTEYNIRNL